VVDIQLPDISGFELQQKLATSDLQIPIIFLTGYGDIPMSVQAIKAGAVDFLTKPFDDECLLEAMRTAVARGNRRERFQGRIPTEMGEPDTGIGSPISAIQNQLEFVVSSRSSGHDEKVRGIWRYYRSKQSLAANRQRDRGGGADGCHSLVRMLLCISYSLRRCASC